MYTSAEEDRSDLFLAAAVYVLGPTILGILLGFLPLSALEAAAPVIDLVVTVSTTVLVPFLLIRYRKQRLSEYGFDGSVPNLAFGFALALPIALVYVASGYIAGTNGALRVPAVAVATTGGVLAFVLDIIAAVCLVLLGVYTTVKARTAFRADPDYLKPTMLTLARYVAIAAAVATGLLFLSFVLDNTPIRAAIEIVAAPLGVAAAVYLVYRGLRGSQLSSKATLLTPMVVLAVGSLVILGGAFNFVFGIWRGAMLAALGLAVGALVEGRRSAMGPLGLALGLAVLTPLLR